MKEIKNIGSRREVFFDEWLIDKMEGVNLKLHHPQPEEVVLEYNQPWEGIASAVETVFKDGDIFRMYYRGLDFDIKTEKMTHPAFTCYAESTDGINWIKPELNLYEFNGSKKNNIILEGFCSNTFTPFIDTNPSAKPEERYKAVAEGRVDDKPVLFAFVSADGIHWKMWKEEPIITKGAFDSQNLAFYDNLRKMYFEYHRGWTEGLYKGIRAIMVSTSDDFENWTDPEFLTYIDSPEEHLYTNGIMPYYRAPHIFIGFPMRFVPERKKGDHLYGGVSDVVFMTSRDGRIWKRYNEAFLRPGLQPERWINRNNALAWGMIETKSKLNPGQTEISLYSIEAYYIPGNRLRRFTIRLDGFVSVHATDKTGYFITHPIIFDGDKLILNYSTSAAGFIKVEILDEECKLIEPYTAELYGDSTEEEVVWDSQNNLTQVKGKPVRLKFTMKDADLYSICFKR
ncbi:MAG: hypothetical protein NC899_03665 [Candidatus Omnitrophica bacterium]|nr:hypothetical protein [Candidatus Omnitrophota bacterium]